MSGDDERLDDEDFEGADEMSLREHFAPVGRSLTRTVTSRSIQAYAVSFVGIVVLSASIGPAIVGGYATVQKDLGLCGTPVLEVRSPADTADLTAADTQPNFPHLGYEELTPATRKAFRTALDVPNHDQKVTGRVGPRTALEDGAVVTYRGAEHYVVLHPDECVPYRWVPLALSIVGLVVGTGLVATPRLRKRSRENTDK